MATTPAKRTVKRKKSPKTSGNRSKNPRLVAFLVLVGVVVLVCVFGGIQLVGLLGVFIGPIIGAVLFSLMRILKKELLGMGDGAPKVKVS